MRILSYLSPRNVLTVIPSLMLNQRALSSIAPHFPNQPQRPFGPSRLPNLAPVNRPNHLTSPPSILNPQLHAQPLTLLQGDHPLPSTVTIEQLLDHHPSSSPAQYNPWPFHLAYDF